MMRTRKFALLAVTATALAVLPAASAVGNEGGDSEACTPGYWKNHTDNWLEEPGVLISTEMLLTDAFGGTVLAYVPQDTTLLDALSFKGGSSTEAAAQLLLRHAVAAYLNAAYDDGEGHLQYPLRRHGSTAVYPDFDGIVPEVNAALASGDRQQILALKDFLDGIANSLDCPLN